MPKDIQCIGEPMRRRRPPKYTEFLTMIYVDHVCLGTRNLWEGTERLRTETGLGFYEGGWFPKLGLANKIFPTGGDTYTGGGSVVVVNKKETGNPAPRFFRKKGRAGDVFIGWSPGVDSGEEFKHLAKPLGSDVFETGL